jgi:hypothetical protein
MSRVVSTTLLLGGAALVATWLATPAASSPTAPAAASAQATQETIPPEQTAVDREVERLRQRLPPVVDVPRPERDPFNFGRLPNRAPADPVPPPVEDVRTLPVLPRLVAIVSEGSADAPVRSAVLSAGDDVQVLKPGQRIGDWRVAAVTGETVVLTSDAIESAFTLTLH